jgi:hypothetical protein
VTDNQRIYPPGSEAALAAGCRCPVLDNGYGRGAYYNDNWEPQYWINGDCPLHGRIAESEPKESEP